jgi:hypothetical protein
MSDLVGRSFVFDDGSKIEVIQIKAREEHNVNIEAVTYHISQGNSLPRKLVMEKKTFIEHFGHLFKD